MSKGLGQAVLLDAVALLEQPGGWTQGHLRFRRFRRTSTYTWWPVVMARCPDGAILDASKKYGGKRAAEEARTMLCKHLGQGETGSRKAIHMWNDDKRQSSSNVIRVMRAAAA